MVLEDYFDFLDDSDIRVKGTRIGIETILYEHLHGSQTPAAIADRFPALTLEQVYATITFYLRNENSMRAYLANWLEHGRKAREQQAQNPSDAVRRLRHLKAEQQAAGSAAIGRQGE